MELGATASSPRRAVEALRRIRAVADTMEIITYPCEMGEDEAKEAGLDPTVIGSIERGNTDSADTKNAAKEMLGLKVDLILFAGGDGTARDICEAVDGKVPVIGIPSGVKIHSAAFAINPEKAGDLTVKSLREDLPLREAEVMDIDEQAFRHGRVSAKLYGYLQVPYEGSLVQYAKIGSAGTEDEEYQKNVIAAYVVSQMKDDHFYIIGPGSTTKPIGDELGIEKTLLGVDVVNKGKMITKDANESQLLKLIEGKKVKIIVTAIGGQGYIFGRGNQQISPEVIRKVGRTNIIILATKNKLNSLIGKPLLVDTGDEEVDEILTGYMKVIVGYGEEVVKKIEH
jgi:predicted polyphosphate/ATP-dependent NAD kinase